ncbi:MAG: SRPBCC family protein [Acidobacteriota bacterium]|nr:MAG: SRPBCC family protein [Acidobacteriota bacterium]
MFTIKAGFTDDIEIRAEGARVREFFLDLQNFAELMPGVDSIRMDKDGVAHWRVAAEIPVVGKMEQNFAVKLEESSEDRIEWGPVNIESGNLLRFSADFQYPEPGVTRMRFTEHVELRREKARELHFLAGVAGEALISAEMTKSVSAMIRVFMEKAKNKLEGN